MKPLSPHDPFDDVMAAALHGDLTPAERAQFESRLQTDPAAAAAYQEALAMHDLLEKTHKSAQPDPAFEQRMVSGVRRKIQTEQHRETAWESVVVMWKAVKSAFGAKRKSYLPSLGYAVLCLTILAVLAGVALGPITNGIASKGTFTTITSELAYAGQASPLVSRNDSVRTYLPPSSMPSHAAQIDRLSKIAEQYKTKLKANRDDQVAEKKLEGIERLKDRLIVADENAKNSSALFDAETPVETAASPGRPGPKATAGATLAVQTPEAPVAAPVAELQKELAQVSPDVSSNSVAAERVTMDKTPNQVPTGSVQVANSPDAPSPTTAPPAAPDASTPSLSPGTAPASSAAAPPAIDTRKLIRNAQLDLEVKSYQAAMDAITAQTKRAGGYVDTSNSQKGGNGKLQGTVVVKVLPQNLDDFLLKLRDLGEVQNQSVSTDDVTKDYYDTQARLANSQRMETQLQELLKRENGKVSDLLAVERELERVRGDIEQSQGQLKLYDFQVQFATITIQMSEKDLTQAAAYTLKELDDFSLFATDVEGTFQKGRAAAADFKAEVLVAQLNHTSGTDVSALLVVSVPPDQIESFLAQIRSLGRVANFTRDTKRIARDGGDATNPADQTLTEKDKVMVNITIRSDDETRKQVALTVVAKAVDQALEQAKAAALAGGGAEIVSSSLNKAPQGQSTAQLSVRVPGKDYAALISAFRALGRTASLSIQRNDDSGPGTNDDDAPVIVSLSLTDDDTPLQETQLSIVASDVDTQAQQLRKAAADGGVEVKASNFAHQPDGTELANITFRLPMSKYAAFMESLKKIGKVESLTVQRDDRPDQALTDDSAPAEINLQLHNEAEVVPENNGLWTTLRGTFGDGAMALLGSVRVIGVMVAFLVPWVLVIAFAAWVGRRIYLWRKK